MDINKRIKKIEAPSYFYEEKVISYTDVLLIISQHIRLILITPTLICTIAIFYVLFFAVPAYTSSAKILSGKNTGNSQVGGIAAQFGLRMPTNQNEPDWMSPDIIKSRTLAREILKRKVDTDRLGKQKPLIQVLTYGDTKPQKPFRILEMDAVDILLDQISVSEDITTGIISVSATASERGLAFQMLNILIEELDLYQQGYNKAKKSKTRKFIEGRIRETEKGLMQSEENLKDFMDRNRRIENSPALQLQRDRLSREVSVLIGVFTTLKQQLETTKIEEVRDSDYVITIDPPEIPQNRSAPQRTKIVVFSGLFGIIFGLFLAFSKHYFMNAPKKTKKNWAKILKIFFENLGFFKIRNFYQSK